MKRWFTTLTTVVAMCVGSMAMAQEVHLARNENAIGQAVAAKLLTDIYKKAGLGINITPLPGARANAVALAGEKDGEVARIAPYFAKNPTLIKVEPGYYYLTTGAFAKSDKGITIASKDDLKKYKVGIVRGIAHAEAATEGLAGLQVTGSYDQLYQMLEAGRIDVAIDEGINGPATLKGLGLKGITQVGEIARLELFNVLTPAKKDLAPKISAAIKALKDSGELAKLTKRYEEEALKN
jgi:hypothetical protein